jgi:hypothetical protein
MLITGGLTIDARIPGTCAIFGRSALMTSSTDKARSDRGFSSTFMLP